MRTLLNELSNLKEDYEYTIIINGVCSYISCRKENTKLNFVSKKQQGLLDFELVKEKTHMKSKVLRFVGGTNLTDKELLDFLLQIVSYRPEKEFIPKLVTIALYKSSKNDPILWEVDMEQSADGSIQRPNFLALTKNGHYSVIGDFYFTDYYIYQERLTELAQIWIDDFRKERKAYKKVK